MKVKKYEKKFLSEFSSFFSTNELNIAKLGTIANLLLNIQREKFSFYLIHYFDT